MNRKSLATERPGVILSMIGMDYIYGSEEYRTPGVILLNLCMAMNGYEL